MFRSNDVTACTICPPNSKTIKNGSDYCLCIPGYYRHSRNGKHMPCYKPPSQPTNLTLIFMDQTSAILSWSPQSVKLNDETKFRNDIVFKVKCPVCNANVVYQPATETFNETKLTLTNLEPVTTYTIQIHSMNGISYLIQHSNNQTDENFDLERTTQSSSSSASSSRNNLNDVFIDESQIKTEFTEITFTTESAILSTVFNVRIISITSKEVELAWDKPIHTDSPIEFYEVKWFPKIEFDSINKSSLSTKESRAHIENLIENTEYGFQVRSKTTNGWGTFSNIIYSQTHQSVSPVYDDSMQMRVVAGATVAVVFILVLGEFFFFFFFKKLIPL